MPYRIGRTANRESLIRHHFPAPMTKTLCVLVLMLGSASLALARYRLDAEGMVRQVWLLTTQEVQASEPVPKPKPAAPKPAAPKPAPD
jgi:hypothetical protein